jgi:arsenate reductase (glutaredoxin)
MASAEFKTVDEYLAAQAPAARKTLEKVRSTILKALPGATELISYRIPTYKIDGTMVLFFAGFPKHYAIYPATARLIDELGAELKSRLQGKATIRFSYDEAVPASLIARIAKARAVEAAATRAAKPTKKKGTRAPKSDAMPITMYGIPNCDTIKKARTWLAEHGIAYAFHDYKKSGIDRSVLQAWAKTAGWETLLNRSGTTFRALSDADKAGITEAKAIKLMLAQPSLIKRPVLDIGGRTLLVGFKPDAYTEALAR